MGKNSGLKTLSGGYLGDDDEELKTNIAPLLPTGMAEREEEIETNEEPEKGIKPLLPGGIKAEE